MILKNPNGYGSIFKLGGKRRKPWAVRLTVGWTDEGRQQYKYLGYYKSRPEAIAALADYNNAPYNLDANRVTFSEMYDMYISSRRDLTEQNLGILRMSYNLSEPLHEMKFAEIRRNHMQQVIDNCDKSWSTKDKIKSLYNLMYRYALENDLVHKNYAQFVVVPPNDKPTRRKPFTHKEIELLWDSVSKVEFVDVPLIMIYTGMRPGELISIKTDNIHLDKRFLIAGIKTKAGIDRTIPIHKRILPLIEKRLNNSDDILSFFDKDSAGNYDALRYRWRRLMKELGLEHLLHDCRHTFATLMDNVGANKLSIKRIMGHSSKSVTDSIYTHKDLEQLIKAIDLLE